MDEWDKMIIMIIVIGLIGIGMMYVTGKNCCSYEPRYGDHVCITDGFYEGQEATIYSKDQFSWSDKYFFILDGKQIIEFDTLKKSEIKKC